MHRPNILLFTFFFLPVILSLSLLSIFLSFLHSLYLFLLSLIFLLSISSFFLSFCLSFFLSFLDLSHPFSFGSLLSSYVLSAPREQNRRNDHWYVRNKDNHSKTGLLGCLQTPMENRRWQKLNRACIILIWLFQELLLKYYWCLNPGKKLVFVDVTYMIHCQLNLCPWWGMMIAINTWDRTKRRCIPRFLL